MRSGIAGLLLGAVFLVGCGNKGSYQLMSQTPRFEPLESDDVLLHGAARRAPVPGTVARGQLDDDALLSTGVVDGQEADLFPFPVTREVLDRGHERFDIFCSPCHGRDGYGRGMVVQRGFQPPPSLHSDVLRAYPAGHLVNVMTRGYGAMPQYAKQVPPRDRWAIAAYIRALQLSQHAPMADLPADTRARIAASTEPPR
jgi:mono/diheme cytochrome c family protein